MPELPQNEVDFLREKLSFLEAELSAKDAALSAKDADLETITARLKKKESAYALLVQRHMELQRNQFVNRDRTLPKSPIGLAIAYCLTHWDGRPI